MTSQTLSKPRSRTRTVQPSAPAQPERLTMKLAHAGQSKSATNPQERFGVYDGEQPLNLSAYVKQARMAAWAEQGGGKSVVALDVTVSPIYEDAEG